MVNKILKTFLNAIPKPYFVIFDSINMTTKDYYPVGKIKTQLLCFLGALFGFVFDWYAYYPGFISPDSLDQYTQAINHSYSDWHPPIMAGFWSLLTHIHKGGSLMFLLQLLCYWSAFYILLLAFTKHKLILLFLIPLIFFAPFMQNFVGNIWKDVGLAISWLLAVSIMINAFYDKRKLNTFEAVLTIVLLSYGCWIRINALPGVIPLLSLWLIMLQGQLNGPIPFKKLALKTVMLTGILIIVQVGITIFFLKPLKTFPQYKLFVHDLTGIYKKTGKLYFPDFIKKHPGFDSLYIKEKYLYTTFDNIWWNNDNKQILPVPNEERIDELQECWMNAIISHPGVYLQNRIIGFLYFLRITNSGSRLEITYNYIHPNDFGLHFDSNRLTNLIRSGIEYQRPLFYMQPWFWILLNLGLLLTAHKPYFENVKAIILCLAYSSLFYVMLEFIVYQADTEFRYFYWNCVAVSLALLIVIGEWFRLKKIEQ